MTTLQQTGTVLNIKGRDYQVEIILTGIEPPIVHRLTKMGGDGAVYDVWTDADGIHHCDCGDQVWRHQDGSGCCKHIVAARLAGLLGGTDDDDDPEPSPPDPEFDPLATIIPEATPADPDDDPDPAAHDEVWWSAWLLGYVMEPADPPAGLSPFEQDSWRDGFDKGHAAAEEEERARWDRLDREPGPGDDVASHWNLQEIIEVRGAAAFRD